MVFWRNISIITLLAVISAAVPVFTAKAEAVSYPLKIERVTDAGFINPDSAAKFYTKVTNSGDQILNRVEVVDKWPAGFTVNGQSISQTVWVVDQLQPGQSVSELYTVAVPSNASLGYLTFSSRAISQTPPVEAVIDYGVEVRQIQILAAEIPTTDGVFSRVYVLGGALIFQLLLIGVFAFRVAKQYKHSHEI